MLFGFSPLQPSVGMFRMQLDNQHLADVQNDVFSACHYS
jgi:hypothetical protein